MMLSFNCRLCGQKKKLVKSHIIPEALHLLSCGRELGVKVIGGEWPKKSLIGIYDSSILCSDCEEGFSLWDDYGTRFLSKDIPEKDMMDHNGIKYAYNINDYDYEKLTLFFLFVLWRASISTHDFYKNVKLVLSQNKTLGLDSCINFG